jgi:hypothetical protein
MVATPAQMVLAVRRAARDWGLGSLTLNETLDSSDTTVDVVDWPQNLKAGHYLECDLEIMEVRDPGPSLVVRRGQLGTTAAAHSTGALMVGQPRFTNTAILAALNKAMYLLAATFPREVYVTDSTLVTAEDVELFTLPAVSEGEGEYIDILRAEIETTTAGLYRPMVNWEQQGRIPPALKLFGSGPTGRAMRLLVTQAYPTMTYTGSTPSGITDDMAVFLQDYAAGMLLEQEELYAADWIKQDVQVASDARGRMQVIGRNMQAAAEAYLNRIKPSVRNLWLGDARNYRR